MTVSFAVCMPPLRGFYEGTAPCYRCIAMRGNLIAHRGGVVSSPVEENTLQALEEAAARGYYGVEIDLRETRDHVVVLHHDPYLHEPFAFGQRISSLSYGEIVAAAREAGMAPPPTLEEAARRCQGRLEVMIELKEADPSPEYLGTIESMLREHGLLEHALAIGSPAGKEYFRGRIRTGLRCRDLARLSDGPRGATLAREGFLFDHGNVITSDDVARVTAAGMLVVPSINLFHYRGEDAMAGARRDAENLLRAGVQTFQIDSAFETYFR